MAPSAGACNLRPRAATPPCFPGSPQLTGLQGRETEANAAFMQSVHVTPDMAHELIVRLRCVAAPLPAPLRRLAPGCRTRRLGTPGTVMHPPFMRALAKVAAKA